MTARYFIGWHDRRKETMTKKLVCSPPRCCRYNNGMNFHMLVVLMTLLIGIVVTTSSFFVVVVDGTKIAFVGDTGMEDIEHNGYGHLTMQMIQDQDVDLVVHVGDYDYWGKWGPKYWNTFVREYDVDFLGASGNAEVKDEEDGYGSAATWAEHQQYMHRLYLDRIYHATPYRRGACHGYDDPTEPGTVQEYGERYSCFYNSINSSSGRGSTATAATTIPNEEHFHFIFLGWWQGSNESLGDDAKEERRKSIEFIDREFESERSQAVPWRFCIHHLTSAKLSAGDKRRDNMILAGITDACRKHGAIIFSGHHHMYSRTKLLSSVGYGGKNKKNVAYDSHANADNTQYVLTEGTTMSITTGMGGYDGSCNGLYSNSSWMEKCISHPSTHRGAVIAEFHGTNNVGTFQYLNSKANGEVVDEFQITSTLGGRGGGVSASKPTTKPSRRPSRKPNRPSRRPTRKPSPPSRRPTPSPTRRPTRDDDDIGREEEREKEEEEQQEQEEEKEEPRPTQKPISSPTRRPTSKKPTQRYESEDDDEEARKPARDDDDIEREEEREKEEEQQEEEEEKEEPRPTQKVYQTICTEDRFSMFCGLINQYELMDYFSSDTFDLTVFVPTNEAWLRYISWSEVGLLSAGPARTFDELTQEQFIYVLLYHLVVGADADDTDNADDGKDAIVVYTYSDLECGGTLSTANGRDSRTKCYGDGIKYQKGPRQVEAMLPMIDIHSVPCRDGIVHAVDQVIMPNFEEIPKNFFS